MFNKNLPLGLPEGSVRAIIALSVVGVALAKFFIDDAVPDQLLAIVGVAVGFYFGSRTAEPPKQ